MVKYLHMLHQHNIQKHNEVCYTHHDHILVGYFPIRCSPIERGELDHCTSHNGHHSEELNLYMRWHTQSMCLNIDISLTSPQVSKLSTHYNCILIPPPIGTHCAPGFVDAHFNSSLITGVSTNQSYITISTQRLLS